MSSGVAVTLIPEPPGTKYPESLEELLEAVDGPSGGCASHDQMRASLRVVAKELDARRGMSALLGAGPAMAPGLAAGLQMPWTPPPIDESAQYRCMMTNLAADLLRSEVGKLSCGPGEASVYEALGRSCAAAAKSLFDELAK